MVKKQDKNKLILFVCLGNTCRSPMAEMIFKHCLKQSNIKGYIVKSCGISPNKKDTINLLSKQALKKNKINCQRFVSKPISPTMITNSFLLLCMTKQIKDYLPNLPHIKTFGEQVGCGDVADPYGGTIDDYMKTCSDLIVMCEILIKQIQKA